MIRSVHDDPIAPAPMSQSLERPQHGLELPIMEEQPRRRNKRARGFCSVGCSCCGSNGAPPVVVFRGPDEYDWNTESRFSATETDASERRSLVLRAAAGDGSREAPYVDTHVHLELVLQKVRWYESAPSLLEPLWEDLADNEKRCWSTLGFTPSTWHCERRCRNPTWVKKWSTISIVEQSAACALGWTAEKWDKNEWIMPMDVLWCDLEEATRGHLTSLGETCRLWDDLVSAHRTPAGYCFGGDMRRWEELSLEEQRAGAELGFSEITWDMLELADVNTYVQSFSGSGFIACITSGCDGESIDDTIALALSHPQVFAAFGCHPKNAWLYAKHKMEERVLAAFKTCGKKAIAWGEFGLDFSDPNWWSDPKYRRGQFEVFERQIQLAIEMSLPFTLHIREADEDALRILKKMVPRTWKAHIHGYHGPSEFIGLILDYFPNFYFGLTGTVAMGSDGDGARLARILPVDRVLLETDGPFMLPRGTLINHSGQIPLIARVVAELKGVSAAEVLAVARANSKFVYGI